MTNDKYFLITSNSWAKQRLRKKSKNSTANMLLHALKKLENSVKISTKKSINTVRVHSLIIGLNV
jgi:hypothetical protein